MKKFAYIILAVGFAAMTVSCAKEASIPDDGIKTGMVTFTASTAQTKTQIADGHTVWSLDDEIKVFYGGGSSVAKLKTGEGSSHATFEAAVPESTDYYAVYPAAVESSNPQANQLSVTIPQIQDGGFGSSHIAVAKGVNKAFAFVNVNSFLKIVLPEAGYKRIVVESPSGKPLSGQVNVSFQGATGISLGEALQSSVEVVSETGFPAGEVFISVIADVTHDKGLLLKYYDSDVVKGSFYFDKEFSTAASTIHSFGEFGVTGEYFATLEGAGNKTGVNEANAMDITALARMFQVQTEDSDKESARAVSLDGATIHLGEGTWDFQDSLLVAFPSAASPVTLSFVGSQTVITGNEMHRIMNIGANANVSFKGITFEKGLAQLSRNAPLLINGAATAHFTDCIFTNCSNQVYNEEKGKMDFATGGCIYADEETDISFDNCEFSFNKGSYAATLLTKGKATIKDCHFHDNDGTWPGSALYIDYEDAQCFVTNSIIEDNSVISNPNEKPDGGAVAVVHGSLTMTDCSLLRNSIPGRRGGALRIFNSDSSAKLVNCTVKGNSAYWGGAINVPAGTLEIQGGNYEDNVGRGGGCILTSGTSSVIIKDALFKNNSVDDKGRFGGAIRHESKGLLTIIGTTFEGNHSDYNGEDEAFGGAVSVAYDQKEAEVIIDNCSFIGNYTVSGGGSALCYQSSGDNGTGWMKVSNTLFQGNHNDYNGNNNSLVARHAGAVRLGHDATNSYFDNCVFKDNYTLGANEDVISAYGGALTFYADGYTYLNHCHFEGNHATRGGAISTVNSSAAGLYLNACSFSGNWTSFGKGTSIYLSNTKTFCMNNCSFADNTYTMLSSGDDAGCWIWLEKILDGCVVSNSSLIGSNRSSSGIIGSGNRELLYADGANSNKHYYIINSVLVAGADNNAWRTNQSNSPNNTYTYNTVYSTKAGNSPYTGSSDTSGKSASDFVGLGWNENTWEWNGTLSGNYSAITASSFASRLNSANSTFKNWLEEKGELNKDQLGNSRGDGNWWPGAYQK